MKVQGQWGQSSRHTMLFHPEMNIVIEPNIELGEGTDREPFLQTFLPTGDSVILLPNG